MHKQYPIIMMTMNDIMRGSVAAGPATGATTFKL